MDIEIWLDLVCPWCYIGKHRFETALAEIEQADRFRIRWHSYELDPDRPRTADVLLIDDMTDRLGERAEAERNLAKVADEAASTGLEIELDKARRVNTRDAHRLVHLAGTAEPALDSAMLDRLMRAYAIEGRSIADADTLVELGSEVGLAGTDVREMLAGNAYDAEVHADRAAARESGVKSVPSFVFGPYGISGAQPPAVFGAMLKAMAFIS